MPKKSKKKDEPTDSEESQEDPSVVRVGTAAPAAPDETRDPTFVLPCKVSAPAPLLPIWDGAAVASTYEVNSGSAEEDSEENASAEAGGEGEENASEVNAGGSTALYTDYTVNTADILPAELQSQPHVWKRPSELESFPFWSDSLRAAEGQEDGENPSGNAQSAPWCMVDFYVPPTEEEAAAAAAAAAAAEKAKADKEAARKAAEEAGEPLTEEEPEEESAPVEPAPPPREILRPLKFSGTFPSQLVSVYELISSVSKSYAAKKASEAPEPPTKEELEAAAAAAEAAAAAAAEAAAAKSKGKKKKGKNEPEPEEDEPPPEVEADPNDPIQPGAFLWEAIYPKVEPGSTTPRYNPSGRYSVRLFVNNAWRRIDVDDRIPVDEKEGRPLLPVSENKFELWPLIMAKAVCIVSRGRWSNVGCLYWINNLCGWVTESTLVAELPPGEDDLDGREHFKSLTKQTWPRILPAVPHQVIVYEEDSESEDDHSRMDEKEDDEGLFGAIDAAEGLLAGATGSGDGDGGSGTDMANSEKSGKDTDSDVSNSQSKSSLDAKPPPFEIHLLLVGDESVIANGAEKVGAEAAEAALQEVYADPDAPKAPPPSLLARCVYHIVATRGGDDIGSEEDDVNQIDDDMVVADDRDVQVSLGMSQAWLTLDNILANFVDPINADRGSMISLYSETSRLKHQQIMEQSWNWAWCTTQQQQTMEKIRDMKAASTGAPDESSEVGKDPETDTSEPGTIPEVPTLSTELVAPETEGSWIRMPMLWGARKVLHFPSDAELLKEAASGEEEASEESPEDGDAMAVPKIETTLTEQRSFVVTLSNHLSLPSQYPMSIARLILRERKANGAVHQIETPTLTTAKFFYTGDSTTFDVQLDAPAGASVTFSSDNVARLFDHAVHAKDVLQRPHYYSISGTSEPAASDNLQIMFRCHFRVPSLGDEACEGAKVSEEKETESTSNSKEEAGALIDADLWIFNPLLRKYACLTVVDHDTGKTMSVPLNRLISQKFPPNKDGYTLMAFLHAKDGMVPASGWRFTVSSPSPTECITDFTQQTLDSTQDFRGAYIPNKYLRICRDVMSSNSPEDADEIAPAEEEEEGQVPKSPCPHTSIRFKLDKSDAAIILRAIVKETNAVLCEATGRGEASLVHVPVQVSVNLPQNTDADVNEEGMTESIQSAVIIEATLDDSRYNVPTALRSVRPYHYPAGQEGDAQESYLTWTCRTISASGVKLARDQSQELKEKAMRDEWELEQEGRSVRAKAKRTRYKYLQAKKNGTLEENTPTNEDGQGASEEANEGGEVQSGPPDGLDGMDEEEKQMELQRRAKLEALPPVTLCGHLELPVETNTPTSKGSKNSKKKAPFKIHYVKRPSKHYAALLTTATEKEEEGRKLRSKFLTDMLIEQGRRRVTSDRQLYKLRSTRQTRIDRLCRCLDDRQKMLFPEIADATED